MPDLSLADMSHHCDLGLDPTVNRHLHQRHKPDLRQEDDGDGKRHQRLQIDHIAADRDQHAGLKQGF
ncbi:hypothetical protein HFO72_31200 [Rhizobium laguerreae]|uniref:hypothetical protein n=1 Tax=Rhizobium laguerreae TaxID=1076926 RepID=UPI001C9172BA|nr:hypothetical protein [Rhizobium laguerreae]